LSDFRWSDLGSEITAFAVNLRPGRTLEQTRLPEKVVSRLSDGREGLQRYMAEGTV